MAYVSPVLSKFVSGYISNNVSVLTSVASALSISATSIAAAIAEEASSVYTDLGMEFGGEAESVRHIIGDVLTYGEKDVFQNYQSLGLDQTMGDNAYKRSLSSLDKIVYNYKNVTARDVGIGNLNLGTAIYYVRQYFINLQGSADKLGLSAYVSGTADSPNYDALAHALTTSDPVATFAVTGLVIKAGITFFTNKFGPNFTALSDNLQAAYLDTFYKDGQPQVAQFKAGDTNAANGFPTFNAGPDAGPGGKFVLDNYDAIQSLLAGQRGSADPVHPFGDYIKHASAGDNAISITGDIGSPVSFQLAYNLSPSGDQVNDTTPADVFLGLNRDQDTVTIIKAAGDGTSSPMVVGSVGANLWSNSTLSGNQLTVMLKENVGSQARNYSLLVDNNKGTLQIDGRDQGASTSTSDETSPSITFALNEQGTPKQDGSDGWTISAGPSGTVEYKGAAGSNSTFGLFGGNNPTVNVSGAANSSQNQSQSQALAIAPDADAVILGSSAGNSTLTDGDKTTPSILVTRGSGNVVTPSVAKDAVVLDGKSDLVKLNANTGDLPAIQLTTVVFGKNCGNSVLRVGDITQKDLDGWQIPGGVDPKTPYDQLHLHIVFAGLNESDLSFFYKTIYAKDPVHYDLNTRELGYVQVKSTGETLVLPQGGIFAAYQADGTPTGDYALPSDFTFTFADGTTVSGTALAALFDQEGASEHLEYSSIGSGDGYTSYETITGDVQNAPSAYLAAEQNGGGPAAPGASTGTATVTDTGSNIAFGYGQGDGTLEITPNYRSIVQFASSIMPSSVAASGDSQGNLTLTDGANGDQVVLDGMLTDPSHAVQSVSFADGTTWTAAQTLGLLNTTGTVGSDTLYGSYLPEVFDGQGAPSGAKDLMVGNGGGDTFAFNQGYGALEVNEQDNGSNPANVLRLGAGIRASGITASEDAGGDVILKLGVNGDQVTLDGMAASAARGVQSIVFADGTTWNAAQVFSLLPNTIGTAGSDALYGTWKADVFDGKGAPSGTKDVETGFGGGDTFIFNQGYGALEINEQDPSPSPMNVLKLGAGIAASSVTVTGNANGDVILTLGASGDQVTLDAMSGAPYFFGPRSGSGVQSVIFSDGTTWSADRICSVLKPHVTGTSGADSLLGTSTGEYIDGLGAPAGSQDYEKGGGGSDTFIYNRGYGQLEVDETDYYSYKPDNVLQLGAGITASQLTVTSDSSGNVYLADGTAGDRIKLDVEVGGFLQGVQSVQFDDGTVLTPQQLAILATTGTTGADNLYGTHGAETFDGKGAPAGSQDHEHGGGGGDTFVYNRGYGQLEVDENNVSGANATLQLGAGIDPSQVRVTADTSNDLILTDGVDGDRITLDQMLAADPYGDTPYGVGQVTFSNGTTWSRDQLLQQELASGTSGNDILIGSAGADLFDGHGGNDYEQGNGGADTFVFDQSYGQLEINETSYGQATLQLGAGLAPEQVQVRADAAGDAILSFEGDPGDQVRIDQMLAADPYGGTPYGVGQVTFGDGTTWSRDQLVQRELASATSGNDTLIGGTGPDLIDGRGGNDYEQGNGGGDTFVFDQGYGQLEINERHGAYTPDNVLALGAGIDPSHLTVTSDNAGNIYLADGTAGDRIKLDGELNGSSYGVQSVQFADGTSLTRAQVIALAPLEGTTGADTLYGTSDPDILDGKGAPTGSQDYEQGNGGDDTFVFNPGYGQLEISEADGASSPANTLRFGPGILPSQVSLNGDYDDWNLNVTVGTGGDMVVLDAQLLSSSYGVQRMSFADGTTWGRAEIVRQTGLGLPGKPVLYGSSGDDVFDPQGQAHEIWGWGGSDTYIIDRGYGGVTIHNSYNSSSPHGHLAFSEAVAPDQLWFAQNGDDLVATVLGTTDQATVKSWFTDPGAPTADIEAAGGARLDAGLGQLVSSMASYQAANPGFNPATASAMPDDPSLRSAIAAAWHG